MINRIRLKNFKSHADTIIKLGNMNILTGMNGMGKSSIIQALLLLRQTFIKGLLTMGLELNGELCSIGTANDAMYRYAYDSDLIEFSLYQQEQVLSYAFKVDASNITKTFLVAPGSTSFENSFNPFTDDFQYISAYRNGPQNDYEKDTATVELFGQISRKEGRGEMVAHYYDYFKDYEVHPDLIEDLSVGTTVQAQVAYWMREISPNINVEVQAASNNFKIEYSFNRGKGEVKTEGFLATNIGFGVSYVLPVILSAIVACSKERSAADFLPQRKLILIENPEAHIHPSAQSKLMELLNKAAKLGVQFIIESHSDHIINSVLVAAKNQVLSSEQINMYYFTRKETEHSSIVTPLPISDSGRIKNPPAGFFDQIDIHMKQLMGF
jgi:predicted ATPase